MTDNSLRSRQSGLFFGSDPPVENDGVGEAEDYRRQPSRVHHGQRGELH